MAAFALDPALTAQAGMINTMMSADMERLMDRREARRALCDAQYKKDELQSKICDTIRANTPKEVQDFLNSLKETQPAVFDYVRGLQILKYGIWCNQCERTKVFTGRDPEAVAADVEAESRGEDPHMKNFKKYIPPSEIRDRTAGFTAHPNIGMITNAAADAKLPASLAAIAGPLPAPAVRAVKGPAPSFLDKKPATMRSPLDSQPLGNGPRPALSDDAVSELLAAENPFDTLPQRISAVRELRNDIADKLSKLDGYIARLEKWSAVHKNEPATTSVSSAAVEAAAASLFEYDDPNEVQSPLEKMMMERINESLQIGADVDILSGGF